MNRMLSGFLDRLAERLTAVIAGVVSSKVESIRAVAQADQQSSLEDLARHYESEGKLGIAQRLRERSSQLTSVNLAGDAVDVMQAVTRETPGLPGPASSTAASPSTPALPDFSAVPARPRKKKPAAMLTDSASDPMAESGS